MSARLMLTQPGRLRLYGTDELIAMPPPEYQIHGLFPENSVVVLYGPPGCFKSFIAGDIAAAIASPFDWHGRETKHGHALYVAAEGGPGMGKRMLGWGRKRGFDPAKLDMSWMLEPLPLQADSDEMSILFDRIAEIDTHPSIVVIDTLARCYIGDENKQEDMGKFIRGVDQLRKELKTTVLIVHHTRLDGDRERGNTALRGAADSMLQVVAKEHKGHRSVAIFNDKQKDEAKSDPIRFNLVVDELNNTLVLDDPLKPRAVDFMQILRTNSAEIGSEYRFKDLVTLSGLHQEQLSRVLCDLTESGNLLKEKRVYRVISW